MKKKIAATLLVAAAALVWASWDRLTQWGFRRALPSSAVDINEWSYEDGFLPDYGYKLKAKITEEEFRQYVDRLKLTPHSATRQYTQDANLYLRWLPGRTTEMAWWDPSDSLDETFVRQRGDNWTFAKRERGYLYLESLEH